MTIWTVPAKVTRVVDGDTLVADLDLGWGVWKIGTRIRLDNINCPEMSTPEGVIAAGFTYDLINTQHGLGPLSTPVTVVSRSVDKYGRVLGIVKLSDGRILNDLILTAGHAVSA